MAPEYKSFVAEHVEYDDAVAFVTVLAGNVRGCEAFATIGGVEAPALTYVDDSRTRRFYAEFGMVRPQFIVVWPNRTLVDLRPTTNCGSCGTWDEGMYASLLDGVAAEVRAAREVEQAPEASPPPQLASPPPPPPLLLATPPTASPPTTVKKRKKKKKKLSKKEAKKACKALSKKECKGKEGKRAGCKLSKKTKRCKA